MCLVSNTTLTHVATFNYFHFLNYYTYCRIKNTKDKEKLLDLSRRDKCCSHHPKDMTSLEYGGTPLKWVWNFNPEIET